MSIPVIFIISAAAVLILSGVILSILTRKDASDDTELLKRIEKALPGIQCGQCGHPGCRGYAEALANGETNICKCTPGGPDTVAQLACILNLSPMQEESDEMLFTPRTVALIDKNPCTGCTKCAKICPVDAIKGKIRYVHEIDPEECIGCGECVDVCPVKCIEMVNLEPTIKNFNWEIQCIRTTGKSTN